jgi:hypothetical protein
MNLIGEPQDVVTDSDGGLGQTVRHPGRRGLTAGGMAAARSLSGS